MAKKLITILLALTMVACSSISIYATDTNTTSDTDTDRETATIEEDKDEANYEAVEEDEEEDVVVKTTTNKTSNTAKEAKYKKGLAAYIRYVNPSISTTKSLNMAGYFIESGDEYNLDPKVLMAIAKAESTFYTNATSPYGYKGLMQTSDALANRYGYKATSLYRAEVSIEVGARYLRAMKNKFGNYTKSLSAYAYGSGAVSSGNYSKSLAYKFLNTRKQINSYLDRNNYI